MVFNESEESMKFTGLTFKALTLVGCVTPFFSVGANEIAPKDIVTTAVEAASFQTLVAAVQAAGLVETLKGKGPFTVLAPTDEAFAKLPPGTVEDLLKPENKQKLIGVLTYHVISGKAMAADVVKMNYANTVNGQRVDLKVTGGKVFADQAQVVKTDIACSNGVIHVIDQVLIPSMDSIPATATKAGVFKTLLKAATEAGLVPALSGDQPLTVFAPTDDAFAKLPAGTVENLLKPENKSQLESILKLHVVAGRVFSDDLLAKKTVKSLQGGELKATVTNGQAKVNGANIVKADVEASNGVIHIIDTVILPEAKSNKNVQIVVPSSQQTACSTQQSGHFMSGRIVRSRRHW